MKIKNLLLVILLSVSVSFISCDHDELSDDGLTENESVSNQKKPSRGPSLSKGTYNIDAASSDALYQFSIRGRGITLRSNPAAAGWGSDFYGYWSNSFSLSANKVQYTNGLSTTIYEFNPQSGGTVNVIKTHILAPYQSNGETVTTITTVGTFTKQ